jgi:hypothetical protein
VRSRLTKCGLTILGALGTGATLFVATFIVFGFVWMKFVVTDPKNTSVGDGVMIVGESLIIGTGLAVLGIGYFLYKFWPRRSK